MSEENDPVTRLEVVGAAIVRGDACLVTQRGPEAAREASMWEFPGGKVEPGEAPRAALEREIREELHLDVEAGSWLGHGTHVDDQVVIELDVFLATITGGEIRLTEHYRYGWFTTEQLDGLDWAPADRPILPALAAFLRGRSER
ncbi:MAG: (deoxy)nucleoside triphosphate pyrophosphohydrolase [bacterium]|nr:(deoxy)nucleoside triphosphate pyrophosphohydrolase [bacterium]